MRLVITFLALFALARPLAGQDRLDGHWRGYWMRAGDSMLVTLEIDRDANKGRYSAVFAAERLRVKGIPFDEVLFDGCCRVTSTLRGDRTTMVFTGTLAGDSLTGSIQETLRGESLGSGRFAYSRMPAGDAPFEEREVTFTNAGVTLAGSAASTPAASASTDTAREARWLRSLRAAQPGSRSSSHRRRPDCGRIQRKSSAF